MNVDVQTSDCEKLEILEHQAVHALRIHQVWRATVRALTAADGRTPPAHVSERACEIDMWLRLGLHPAFRGLPLYEQTLQAHAAFHRALAALYADRSASSREVAMSATILK
ncbi:MAG: hypothetical protein GIX03_10325, partial [Candidatus Eremiobacteraeota bacterium]|nr:hypothetical protein [Candidatus Eremiobacteraeota bacterium]